MNRVVFSRATLFILYSTLLGDNFDKYQLVNHHLSVDDDQFSNALLQNSIKAESNTQQSLV